MNLLPMVLRLVFKLKIELILIFLFSCVLIFYSINPYVINPVEFTLYTQYFIPFGFGIWFYASFRVHFQIAKSIPTKWIAMNEIVQNPKKLVITQTLFSFGFFLIIQILTAIIIASTIVFNFSSGIDLFIFLLELYMIYFAFPFTWAWLAGLLNSLIHHYYSSKKGFAFLTTLLLWVVSIFYLEYKFEPFNVFIENRFPYIDAIHNLTFQNDKVSFIGLYLFCTIVAGLAIILAKRSIFGISISVTLFTLLTFSTYYLQTQTNSKDILQANDLKLYQQIKGQEQGNIKMTNNWRITGVKVEPETQHPIQIELTLDKKQAKVGFSINEQFSIARIESEGKSLSFDQQGRSVEVQTNGVESLVLYYKKTMGTSFYPLMSNAIYLPAEANWYPQQAKASQYILDSNGNLHPNVTSHGCKQVRMVLGKDQYSWQGEKLDCLSIIKGSFKQIEESGMKLIVYKPFLTQKENYVELANLLYSTRKELCQTIGIKDNNYCANEIKSIHIAPKSHNTPSLSLYDSTFSNGNYTFFVDPFLNVSFRPLHSHIGELSTVLIPFRVLEDEKLSLLISQYLNEKFKINPIGYLDWLVKISPIKPEEWDRYKKLTIEEKRNVIIQRVMEMRGDH